MILAMGEPLVEFNAAADGAFQGTGSFHGGYGGDTSNMIVAAARSGAGTGYVTRVGDDAFGDSLFALWEREGVDVSHVVREPGGATGLYFVTRHGPGRHVFTYRRAGSPASRLRPADVPEEAVASAGFLHLSGITQAIGASCCDAAFHAIDVARAAGTPVSYDPNHRPALWPLERARAVVRHTASLADLVLPNLEEGRLLTGAGSPEQVLDAFRQLGPPLVALKLGADGVLLGHHGRTVRVPAHPVEATDATGAGDTFDGAFTARLAEGAEPEDAARYAVVAAALTTTGHGAVTPIPRREAVDSLR